MKNFDFRFSTDLHILGCDDNSQFLQNVCVCDTNIVAALDQKLMVRFSCILMYVIFLPQAVMYRKHFCVGIDEILVPYLPFSMLSMLDQV